jgi:hypothetical protein
MTEHFNTKTLVASRATLKTYHVAAEQHIRVEFRNLAEGESVEPFTYQGGVVLTCYAGTFAVTLASAPRLELVEHEQLVISADTRVYVECVQAGTLQFIWAPAQAVTVKG